MGPQHGEPIPDARHAVGDLGEVVAAELLPRDLHRLAFILDRTGAIEEEWTVVGADGL